MVHVRATDAPVTIDETEDVMDEMAANGIEACDLLGLGVGDVVARHHQRARSSARARPSPASDSARVMERQVTELHAVRFFELADAPVRCPASCTKHASCSRVRDRKRRPHSDEGPRTNQVVVRPHRLLVGRLRLTAMRSSTTSGSHIEPARNQCSRCRPTGTSIQDPVATRSSCRSSTSSQRHDQAGRGSHHMRHRGLRCVRSVIRTACQRDASRARVLRGQSRSCARARLAGTTVRRECVGDIVSSTQLGRDGSVPAEAFRFYACPREGRSDHPRRPRGGPRQAPPPRVR